MFIVESCYSQTSCIRTFCITDSHYQNVTFSAHFKLKLLEFKLSCGEMMQSFAYEKVREEWQRVTLHGRRKPLICT